MRDFNLEILSKSRHHSDRLVISKYEKHFLFLPFVYSATSFHFDALQRFFLLISISMLKMLQAVFSPFTLDMETSRVISLEESGMSTMIEEKSSKLHMIAHITWNFQHRRVETCTNTKHLLMQFLLNVIICSLTITGRKGAFIICLCKIHIKIAVALWAIQSRHIFIPRNW